MQHAPAATIWPVSTSTGRASSPRPMSTCRRVDATIRPRLRPALVERDLAIVDPLLVVPFLAEPLLASKLCGAGRGHSGVCSGCGLSAGIDRRKRNCHHEHNDQLFRHELQRGTPSTTPGPRTIGGRGRAGTPFLAIKSPGANAILALSTAAQACSHRKLAGGSAVSTSDLATAPKPPQAADADAHPSIPRTTS